MICHKCSKQFEGECHNWCDSECTYQFCSGECADITAIEDYTPACPGVYWCSGCRDSFLEAAKGHKFIITDHEGNNDLWTYVNPDYKDGCFTEQCINCGIWSYEFKSHTNAHSQYEGHPCTDKIRELKRDDIDHLKDVKWEKKEPMKTVYILFGEMGCGKTYCGSRYAKQHGFKFFDGDSVLTPKMIEKVSKFKTIPQDTLDEYMDILFNAIADQMLTTDYLVVSQALYLNKDRQELCKFLQSQGYQVRMRWVQSTFFRNVRNLLTRNDGWKWVAYWLLNKAFFQKPTHEYEVFPNIEE